MKYIVAPLLISLANAADCDYKPGNDVTDHSKSAVDALRLKEAVNAGDTDKAMEIYTNPTTRIPGICRRSRRGLPRRLQHRLDQLLRPVRGTEQRHLQDRRGEERAVLVSVLRVLRVCQERRRRRIRKELG